MFVHIVCWTQSERSKPGNLDHLHSLWLHRRAPRMAGGLLCHRVSPFKTIFTLAIFERVSSLVWVVLWFLLVADSPETVVTKSLFSSCCDPKFSAPVYICWGEETHYGVHRKGDRKPTKKITLLFFFVGRVKTWILEENLQFLGPRFLLPPRWHRPELRPQKNNVW